MERCTTVWQSGCDLEQEEAGVASQLMLKQRNDKNKKSEDKIKELKAFIERFSANASKSKQATSRKKLLDKLNVEEIKPSSRKYPHIVFKPEREAGKDLLEIKQLTGSEEAEQLFKVPSLSIRKGEKVAFIGKDSKSASLLLKTLANLQSC